jgi:hypothetical protein
MRQEVGKEQGIGDEWEGKEEDERKEKEKEEEERVWWRQD